MMQGLSRTPRERSLTRQVQSRWRLAHVAGGGVVAAWLAGGAGVLAAECPAPGSSIRCRTRQAGRRSLPQGQTTNECASE